MSGKGGGQNNGGGKGLPSGIPAGSRKMVQSLKEIVSNIPDHEIYAALKDCNMDPNEAVSRLLSQDPFHEVKSKRDKKKESKDITDFRPRATSNTSTRGSARAGTDRHVGRVATNQYSSSDSGLLQAKPVIKKENGTPAYGGSTSYASSVVENNVSRQLPSYSDSVGACDGLSSSSQHGGFQSAWMGNPGQVSMADIVKMGRPQAKASMPNSSIHSGNRQNVFAPPAASQHNLHSSQHASKVSETSNDQGFAMSHNVQHNDEWPTIEHQPPVTSSVDAHANPEYNTNSSNFGEANRQFKTQVNECVTEDGPVENLDNVGSASVSAKSLSEDNPESAAVLDGSFYKDVNSYQSQRHPFDNNEAEDVSSVATNLEQLNLHKDDHGRKQEEGNPPVLIPNHLQLHTPECLNLSFGSFGSANNPGLPGSGQHSSQPLESNLEESSRGLDVSTIGSQDARNPDFYGDEHQLATTTSDGNFVHGTGADAGTYEHASNSQPETLKSEPPETAQENQYSFHSSSHEFNYENAQQPDVFTHSQTSSQMQNLSPFSSVMQGYSNSLPSSLLASTVQTAREEIPYSPFPATQSMPAKYSNITTSIGGPTITMSEALRANSISTPQPNPQALAASVATAPALPQHLAVHPYSQPNLPLGHFANMISYQFMPQSYTYMPSAFQQPFAGNNTYHQSLAAVLPQYKNSISVSSLPQSAAVASGYGFGSSTNIPGGNFPLNQPSAPTSTTIGYEDVINSQYKDNNHMISLQQNENSAMWVQGPGSRTISGVPPSNYYNFQGQNHQQGGYHRQSQQQQQPSQHFGGQQQLGGYPNFYHSQGGISMEHHQQQNPREASLAGSQSQAASKQSQQLWQNTY